MHCADDAPLQAVVMKVKEHNEIKWKMGLRLNIKLMKAGTATSLNENEDIK